MALFRFTLDGNILADEPEGGQEIISELRRDKQIRGQLLLMDLTLKFKEGTDGYAHLKPLIDCRGFCDFSTLNVEEDCNQDGNWVTIFEGTLFYTLVREFLFPCILECQLKDNSYAAQIDNNKNIEAFVNVGRSKNDEIITALSLNPVRFFDVSTGTYTSLVNVFDVWQCFRFIISYMTDGEMGFVSDYFGALGEGRGLAITTGEQIRLTSGGAATKFPFISFQKIFEEVNKKVRIAFSIETIAGVKTMRIEPESYFYNTGISTTLNNVKGIIKSVNTAELYSRLKIGSTETIEYVLGQTDFPTDIPFAGFKEESYTMTGRCNIDNTLDLVSDWIIDSNVIQDVFTNGNTGYDDDIFFIMCDFDTSVAVQTDVFGTGGAPLFYNDFLRNANVAQRWLGGIPNSIAIYLGDGNDEFQASVNAEVQHIVAIAATATYLEPLEFQNDFTAPNFDPNNNYSTITYEFTAPATGLYSFNTRVVWKEGPTGTTAFDDFFRNNIFTVIRTPLQDYEQNFSLVSGECVSFNTPPPTYLQGGDTVKVVIKFDLGVVIVATIPFTAEIGSYFTCLSAANGGGIFQTYNPEDFKAYQYEFQDYPLTFAQYQTIIANPLKLLEANDINGWIENMKYRHKEGKADFVLSKSLPKTICE